MLYMLDTADINAIKRAAELYPLSGVTTNPTIIAKEKKEYGSLLADIRNSIGEKAMLYVQVIGTTAEQMVQEAAILRESIGGNLYIKIPVTQQGIKAIKVLKSQGFNITATAIFTAQQSLIAAVAGADFVAPYVNRIDNISGNGVQVVEDIVKLLSLYQLETKVLAASFKNVQQVHEVSLRGAHSITVNPEIMDLLLAHPLTDWSVDQFIADWKNTFDNEGFLLR